MSTKISDIVKNINTSPTLSLNAIANELRKKGKDIIVLSSGELEYDTPEYIRNAAIAAIKKGYTRYTPVDGILELKNAIINKFKKENNLCFKKNNIIVSSGAKQSIFNLMQSIINPGDEVIIVAPYWVSYPEIARLSQAKIVTIN